MLAMFHVSPGITGTPKGEQQAVTAPEPTGPDSLSIAPHIQAPSKQPTSQQASPANLLKWI